MNALQLLVSHDYAKSPLMEAEDSNSSMASAKVVTAAAGGAKPEAQDGQEQEGTKKEEKVSHINDEGLLSGMCTTTKTWISKQSFGAKITKYSATTDHDSYVISTEKITG